VHVFSQKLCPHCQDFRKFLEEVDLSNREIRFYDMEDGRNLDLLLKYAKLHGLSFRKLTTPIIFFRGSSMVGFERDRGDGEKFLELLAATPSNSEERAKSEAREPAPLSLVSTLSVALENFFSSGNLHVFLFLLLVLFCCSFTRGWTLVSSYFCFYAVTDFLFLTKQLSIVLMAWPLRLLLLFLGHLYLYRAIDRLLGTESRENVAEGPLASPTIFYATLLTMLSSSTKFLAPAESWQNYGLALARGAGGWLDCLYALVLSISYSALNALAVFLLWKVIKKYKNYFIDHLTTINNLLSLMLGIFVLLL
jgi:glutaredoxin